VQSGAASEVGDDGTPRHGAAQQRGAVEEPGLTRVAPLACPFLVHRDGVAIHMRSIATPAPEARIDER
jgi:hypothetical protein